MTAKASTRKATVDQVVALKADVTDAITKLIYAMGEAQKLAASRGDEPGMLEAGYNAWRVRGVYDQIQSDLDHLLARLEARGES